MSHNGRDNTLLLAFEFGLDYNEAKVLMEKGEGIE